MEISEITAALVVAAGDVDMFRDWATDRHAEAHLRVRRHLRGKGTSQLAEYLPFTFPTTATYGNYPTYLSLSLLGLSSLRTE